MSRAEYLKHWRKSNPEKVAAYGRAHKAVRAPLRQLLIDAKRDRPCALCGGMFHPVCMDFHHRDPATKLYNVASMVGRRKSVGEIQAEIDKCDLYCANCHRLLSHAPEELIN